MIADLHTHSHYSDGYLSPKDLIRTASDNNCTHLALTDHDSVKGLEQASEFAKLSNIKLINGVEVSSKFNHFSLHIVGLGIDHKNDSLLDGLERNNRFRVERAKKISEGLEIVGIEQPLIEAKKLSKTKNITRTHFAQMLVKKGICPNVQSVFKKFMTGNKPGAVKGEWIEASETIHQIHKAGGLAVLAHPFRYKLTLSKLKKIIISLKDAGLDGLEIVNSFSTSEETHLIKNIADENHLLYSFGSDFHGWPNQNIKIGGIPAFDYGDNSILDRL